MYEIEWEQMILTVYKFEWMVFTVHKWECTVWPRYDQEMPKKFHSGTLWPH
jgi:hypothetical protein